MSCRRRIRICDTQSGWPRPAFPVRALTLTRELDGTTPHGNRLVSLAMAVPRSGGFFELDHGLVRLLESALDVADEPHDRARLMGRLASELRVDVTAERPASPACRRCPGSLRE